MQSATGHIVIAEGADYHDVLDSVVILLADDYHVTHTTIQCEPDHHQERPTPI